MDRKGDSSTSLPSMTEAQMKRSMSASVTPVLGTGCTAATSGRRRSTLFAPTASTQLKRKDLVRIQDDEEGERPASANSWCDRSSPSRDAVSRRPHGVEAAEPKRAMHRRSASDASLPGPARRARAPAPPPGAPSPPAPTPPTLTLNGVTLNNVALSKRKWLKHRLAISDGQAFDEAATKIQRKWRWILAPRKVALIRLIYSVARRKHAERPTFQERLAEQKEREASSLLPWSRTDKATLGQLLRCKITLREVFQDVMYAVRACLRAHRGLQHLRDAAQRRAAERAAEEARHAEVQARVQAVLRRQRPKLFSLGVLGRQMREIRRAESEWEELQAHAARAAAATPNAKARTPSATARQLLGLGPTLPYGPATPLGPSPRDGKHDAVAETPQHIHQGDAVD